MTRATGTTGTALFVGPHPDDIEIFAGGTAARLARLGHRVVLCDLTRGERASHGTVEVRAREASAAAEALGASERRNLGLPDTGIGADHAEHVRALVACIREVRPDVLFAPWVDARHPDHAAAGALARRAAFVAGLRNADADGVPHRPASMLLYPCRVDATPTLVVPLSQEDADAKRRAIAAHASQVSPPDGGSTLVGHGQFLDVLAARDRTWGAYAGVDAAEPFVSARMVVDDDPVAWALAHPADSVHWFPGRES